MGMDTVMVPDRYAGRCKMDFSRKFALIRSVRITFKRIDHQSVGCSRLAAVDLVRLMKLGVTLLIALAATPLNAQSPPPRAASTTPATPAVTSADAPAATANAPSFRVVPQFEINERYTDNAALSNSAPQSDSVTAVTAGLRVDYQAARAKALLDYRVDRLFYRQRKNLNSTQHLLNSNATLEAVEKWLFLDASASITQQNRSAFGSAGISDVNSSRANRVETTTYQVAPNIRGNIADVANYMLRANGAETSTGDSAFPDSRTYAWTGFVKSTSSAGPLGWSVDGTALSVDNSSVGKRLDSRIRAAAIYEIDAQLHLSLSAGKEFSDLDGREKSTTNTRGMGFEWSPSERTQLAAITQKRFFGSDHLVVIAHRTALSTWRFSSAREVVIPTATSSTSVNNPEQTGFPASSGIQDGLLAVRPYLSRRQEASVTLLGLRNTITLAVSQRDQRAIEGSIVTPGGVAPTEEFRQFRANAAWAYRLSPLSTLRLVISHLRTEGLFSEARSTSERLQSLFFVTQLGTRTSASVGLRRIHFDSTVASSFRENAFVSSLSVRF